MKRKAIPRPKAESYIIKCDRHFVTKAFEIIDDKRVFDLQYNENVIYAKRFKIYMSIDLIRLFYTALRMSLYFPKATVSIINVTSRRLGDVCKS